jgi:hypothetical protein
MILKKFFLLLIQFPSIEYLNKILYAFCRVKNVTGHVLPIGAGFSSAELKIQDSILQDSSHKTCQIFTGGLMGCCRKYICKCALKSRTNKSLCTVHTVYCMPTGNYPPPTVFMVQIVIAKSMLSNGKISRANAVVEKLQNHFIAKRLRLRNGKMT